MRNWLDYLIQANWLSFLIHQVDFQTHCIAQSGSSSTISAVNKLFPPDVKVSEIRIRWCIFFPTVHTQTAGVIVKEVNPVIDVLKPIPLFLCFI